MANHRILHCAQSTGVATSTAEWVTKVDGGLDLLPGTQMTIRHAAVHKPGADASAQLDSIIIPTTMSYSLNPVVGFTLANDDPNRVVGLTFTPGSPTEDHSYRTVHPADKATGTWNRQIVKITVPPGVYTPAALAALLTDQTRNPTSTTTPNGTLLGPCVYQFGEGGPVYPADRIGSGDLDGWLQLTGLPLPVPAAIMAQFPVGSSTTVRWVDNSGVHLEQLSNVNFLDVNTAQLQTDPLVPSDGYNYSVQPNADSESVLRYINPADAAGDITMGARSVFGSTIGISHQYNTTTGRFQMSCHSPLYGQGSQSSDVVVALGETTITVEPTAFNGRGARGQLHWPKDSWGVTADNWSGCLWDLMGYAYSDLNGTDLNDQNQWVSSDGYYDTSFDQQQLGGDVNPLPLYTLEERVFGPVGGLVSTIRSTDAYPYWLVEVSIKGHAAGEWVGLDGRSLGSIAGIVPKTYSSLDHYQSEGGPVWTIPEDAAPIQVGSIRVRLLNGSTGLPDTSVGPGSSVILELQ